ncbi:MAG: hypothetical protein N3J91_06960 [Verrucomicrobiae bacterium]|nr:hypothetical protein [Verrucomicrobiae bacterium]
MSWWGEKRGGAEDRVERRLARARARMERERLKQRRRGAERERLEWEMDGSWLVLGEGSRMRRRMG